MKLDHCSYKVQIREFISIRDDADRAYSDLISDTTEENRGKYRRRSEDYLYAQLMLLTRLRSEPYERAVELEKGTLVWDDDWPHRIHIVNQFGRDRCDRCHGQKFVEARTFNGKMWVECNTCASTGKEFVSLIFKTQPATS